MTGLMVAAWIAAAVAIWKVAHARILLRRAVRADAEYAYIYQTVASIHAKRAETWAIVAFVAAALNLGIIIVT